MVWLQLGVQGILVLDARKGGPAWKSGIKGTSRDKYGRLVLGDIITALNGKRVRTASDLYKLLDKCSIGDKVDMEVCYLPLPYSQWQCCLVRQHYRQSRLNPTERQHQSCLTCQSLMLCTDWLEANPVWRLHLFLAANRFSISRC